MFEKTNIDVFAVAFNSFINLSFNIFSSSAFFLHELYSIVIATKLNRENEFNLFLMSEIREIQSRNFVLFVN